MSNIKSLIATHGKEKVKALLMLQPLNTCMGMIAFTSSSDEAIPILCEVTEERYKVEEGYKIGWKPIPFYAPKPRKGMPALMEQNGYASETFYQSDFDSMVQDGRIKVYIEA